MSRSWIMCTGMKTAGFSGGYTSNVIVSVATAATSWSCSHSIDCVDRPGEDSGVSHLVARPEEMHLSGPHEDGVPPGSTTSPLARAAHVEVVTGDRVVLVEVVDAVGPATSRSTPRVTTGPKCSMPSWAAPASAVTTVSAASL